jgi:hypothetical protein
LLVNVKANKCLKELEVESLRSVLRYSNTRVWVFPEPAEALMI